MRFKVADEVNGSSLDSQVQDELGIKLDQLDQLNLAIQRTCHWFRQHQFAEGYWTGEVRYSPLTTAEHVFLMKALGLPLPSGRREKILKYFRYWRNPDGSWGNHWGQAGDLTVTTEVYFAQRLLDVSRDDPEMVETRQWICNRGGPLYTRSWCKLYLALFGQYEWQGLPPLPPEMILLPAWFPFHLYNFANWVRSAMIPMFILATLKPRFPAAGIEERYDIRSELYSQPYQSIRWGKYRFGRVLPWWLWLFNKALWFCGRGPLRTVRRRAVERCLEWLLGEQEQTGCHGGNSISGTMTVLALAAAGLPLEHRGIAQGIDGILEKAWEDEEQGFRVAACSTHTWDTAFSLYTLLRAGVAQEDTAVQQAAQWLIGNQVLIEEGGWRVKNSEGRPGGWCLGYRHFHSPITDGTAMVLLALATYDPQAPRHEYYRRGVEWLLSMQSDHGGWGAYTKNTHHYASLLNELAYGEFPQAMVDPGDVEVTATILEALVVARQHYPGLAGRLEAAISRGKHYILARQEADGSWFGRWGINYIYGTSFVLRGLGAIGMGPHNEPVRRAADWLLDKQNLDGGWGETIETYTNPDLRGQGPSTATQTAWALIGLEVGGLLSTLAARRGVEYLLREQGADGTWEVPFFEGTIFPTVAIKYDLYRTYFPLWALADFQRVLLESK